MDFKKIVIGILLVIVCIGIFFLVRYLRIKKYQEIKKDIDSKSEVISNFTFTYHLKLLKDYGKTNEEFAKSYETLNNKYENLSERKKVFDEQLKVFEEYLSFNNLKELSDMESSLTTGFEELYSEFMELKESLEKYRNLEHNLYQRKQELGKKYNDLKAFYNTNKYTVADLAPNLETEIINVEGMFTVVEGYTNSHHIDKANEALDAVETRIEFLQLNTEEIKERSSFVRDLIPQRLKKVKDKIYNMRKAGFEIERLFANYKFEDLEESLVKAKTLINELKYDEYKVVLDSLYDNLKELSEELTKEEQAKNEFLSIQQDIFNLVDKIVVDYKHALSEFKKLEENYYISSPSMYIDHTAEVIEKIVDDAKNIKYQIEHTRFSYVEMVHNLKDLNKRSEDYAKVLEEFFRGRDDYYAQENRAQEELTRLNTTLLLIKSRVKNEHIPTINQAYKNKIELCYQKADEIRRLRESKPINLEKLTESTNQICDVIYTLFRDIHNLYETAKMCEEFIVYGNRYRHDNEEVNLALGKAEMLYYNGDYSEALYTAASIVGKIDPSFMERYAKNTKNPTA